MANTQVQELVEIPRSDAEYLHLKMWRSTPRSLLGEHNPQNHVLATTTFADITATNFTQSILDDDCVVSICAGTII